MRRRVYGGSLLLEPPVEDGGGTPAPEVTLSFAASSSFDPNAPTWRDGTALDATALAAWQGFYNRISWFLGSYDSSELDLSADPYKVADNGGWGSYEMARGLRNWGSLLLQLVAALPWEGIPLLGVEVANRLLASRQDHWTPDPGFSYSGPWSDQGHLFWQWKAGSAYNGTDLNTLDEGPLGAMLACWTRLLWENRHIPACATAASQLFEHYRDQHVAKWVARMGIQGYGPYNLNKLTLPQIHPTSSHTWAAYLIELAVMEPVARALDPAWATSKYDALERGVEELAADTFAVRYGQSYMGVTNRSGGMHTVQEASGIAYVWTGGQMLGDASSGSAGVARTNQYTAYTVNHLALLNLARPDLVSDEVMTRLAKTTRHRYWRVPASQVVSNARTYIWGDHALAWEDSSGVDHVGSPIVTREGQTIPNITDPSYRRPPNPGHNTTHPFHHVAYWDGALLPYLDAMASVMSSAGSMPYYFSFPADKLLALGRGHAIAGGGSGGGDGGGGGITPTVDMSAKLPIRVYRPEGYAWYQLPGTTSLADKKAYLLNLKNWGYNALQPPELLLRANSSAATRDEAAELIAYIDGLNCYRFLEFHPKSFASFYAREHAEGLEIRDIPMKAQGGVLVPNGSITVPGYTSDIQQWTTGSGSTGGTVTNVTGGVRFELPQGNSGNTPTKSILVSGLTPGLYKLSFSVSDFTKYDSAFYGSMVWFVNDIGAAGDEAGRIFSANGTVECWVEVGPDTSSLKIWVRGRAGGGRFTVGNVTFACVNQQLYNVMTGGGTAPKLTVGGSPYANFSVSAASLGSFNERLPSDARAATISVPGLADGTPVTVSYDAFAFSRNSAVHPLCALNPATLDAFEADLIAPWASILGARGLDVAFISDDELWGGLGRDSRSRAVVEAQGWSNAQAMAAYTNGIARRIRKYWPNCVILNYDDMYDWRRRNGREWFQLVYGGRMGSTQGAVPLLDAHIYPCVWKYDQTSSGITQNAHWFLTDHNHKFGIGPGEYDLNIDVWIADQGSRLRDGSIVAAAMHDYGNRTAAIDEMWRLRDAAEGG